MAILNDAISAREDYNPTVGIGKPARSETATNQSSKPVGFSEPTIMVPPTIGVNDSGPDIVEPVDGTPPIDPAGTTVQDLYGGGNSDATPTAVGPNASIVDDPSGASVAEVDTSGGVGTVNTPGTGTADPNASIQTGVDAVGAVGTGEQTDLTPEQQVDAELVRILGQDSPLLAQARANAAQMANARGLQNTSMAVGMSQAEMVKAALPMAQQNAAQAFQREQGNTESRQQANLFTAQETARLRALEAELGTSVSVFNAEQLNEAESLSAQMRTAIAQQDSEAYNRASMQLAELQRQAQAQQADIDFSAEQQRSAEQQAYNQQIVDRVTRINEQYLQGNQAMDLATIQGTFQQIISTNETAAGLYRSYLDGMAGIMSNPDMDANQIASAVGRMQQMLAASLRMMTEINGLDIGVSPTGGPTTPGAPPPPPNTIPPNIYPGGFGGGLR